MRRRKRDNTFSLFSFQDIITGLCGIMIFMVLVQVVDLVLEGGDANPLFAVSSAAVDDRESLRSEIAALEKELLKVKRASSTAVMAVRDKAKPEEAEILNKNLTEKELVVAALVSQIHDLETQVEAARKADADDSTKIKEMERTRRLLEQQLAGMKGRRGITLIPERGEFKLPMYMICSWAGIEIHRPFETKPSKKIPPEEISSRLPEYLGDIDHTTHSVVLLVRPSGVKQMDVVVDILKNYSFTFGRDPLEESCEVAFSIGGRK